MRSKEPGARSRGLLFALFVLICTQSAAAESFKFDDVDFWIGEGPNRAAMVMDWVQDSTEPPALVWGYRWDGAATGADMLEAIVANDDRLFAKLGGSTGNVVALYGLGYDTNDDGDGDGVFSVLEEGGSETEINDPSGILFTGPSDLATATDPDDLYAEGWYTGFWHYGIASSSPYDGGSWSDPPTGMASRMLADGVWDGWVFSPTFDFTAFAENPEAAVPSVLPGDYNRDDSVDEDDYILWRNTFGSTELLDADGNDDGIVDAADYVVWRDHFGATKNVAASQASQVPEPAGAALAVWALFIIRLLICGKPQMIANES